LDIVGKVEGLMSGGITVDVWKGESSTSINQLQSCMNNLLTMQKVFTEKLGAYVPPIENLTTID
jgi:hypothetical protein